MKYQNLLFKDRLMTCRRLLKAIEGDRGFNPIFRSCMNVSITNRFRVRQEGAWCELDVQTSACIEILLPAQVCIVRRDDGLPIGGYQVRDREIY